MPGKTQYKHNTHKQSKQLSQEACKKLVNMHVRISPTCDHLLYTELYTIDVYADTFNLYDRHADPQQYIHSAIMRATQTTYHLCTDGISAFTDNELSSIVKHTIRIFPEDLIPYKVLQVLSYAFNNNRKHIFNLIRDKNSINELSSVSAHNMLKKHINATQHKCRGHDNNVEQLRLRQVYVALGYDCYSYCARAQVHCDSKIQHKDIEHTLRVSDTGCFGHTKLYYFPDVLTQHSQQPLAIEHRHKDNYYIRNVTNMSASHIIYLAAMIFVYVIAKIMGECAREILNSLHIIANAFIRLHAHQAR